MESFTQRIEAEDESDITEFSIISDNGFASLEELHSEISGASSTDFQDEVHSANSTRSKSPYQKRIGQFEVPEFLRRLNVFEEVEHGGIVTFECQCKAHPRPVSKWYKDDVELIESDRTKIENSLEIDGTLRLIISNVRKSDEGAYRCKIENQEGVAATTGYLSVAGNSTSPKSDHAISAAPLLRAITEESNVSQDSEEGPTSLSTSIEKILTGEYDVTTLPYSHYLELLKGSGALNPGSVDSISAPGNREKGGNRTPTEYTPHTDDIKNLFTDFAYDTSIPVVGDDDVSYFSDQLVTKAMNQTDIDAEEIVSRPKAEVIFGTPLLTDSKTVFVIEGPRREVSPCGLESEMSQDSEEKLEEMEDERFSGFDLEETRGEKNAKAKGYAVDLELSAKSSEPSMWLDSRGDAKSSEPSMWLDSRGDFGNEGVLELLDENRLKETVIAGRIGMPSDWEFAHYSPEADEGGDFLNAIPDFANATPCLPVETSVSKHEKEEAEETVLETEMEVPPLPSETAVPASENQADKKSHSGGGTLFRDPLLGGNAPEMRDEEANSVPANADKSFAISFLPDKIKSSVAEECFKIRDKADVEDISPLSPSDRIALTDMQAEEVKAEVKREVIPEGQPERDGVTNSMSEITSFAELVFDVPSLVNCNANSAAPGETEVQTHKSEVSESSGDGLFQSTKTAAFHFASQLSALTPTLTAVSDWIPDVSMSSFLPDLSPEQLRSEQKPVSTEDIVAELAVDEVEQEPKHAIDWCMDWFRYPSIYYVLLVLTSTLFASATQMNPALLVLIVAMCSILGFHLLPAHEAREN